MTKSIWFALSILQKLCNFGRFCTVDASFKALKSKILTYLLIELYVFLGFTCKGEDEKSYLKNDKKIRESGKFKAFCFNFLSC